MGTWLRTGRGDPNSWKKDLETRATLILHLFFLPHLEDRFTDIHHFLVHQSPEPKKAIRSVTSIHTLARDLSHQNFLKTAEVSSSWSPQSTHILFVLEKTTVSNSRSLQDSHHLLFWPREGTEHTLESSPLEAVVTQQSNFCPQTLATAGTRKFSTPHLPLGSALPLPYNKGQHFPSSQPCSKVPELVLTKRM